MGFHGLKDVSIFKGWGVRWVLGMGVLMASAGSLCLESPAPSPSAKLQTLLSAVQGVYDLNTWLSASEVAFHTADENLARMMIDGLGQGLSEGEGYLYKGVYARCQGNTEMASQYLEISTRSENKTVRSRAFYFLGELTYLNLKGVEQDSKELERGHYFFQKSIDMDAKYAPAYFGIARRYIHQQSWDKAQEYLRMALKHDPEDFFSLFNLGLILAAKKQWVQAFSHLQAAYGVRPQDLQVQKELIQVADRVGEKQLAMEVLSRYLDNPRVTGEEAMPLVSQVLFSKIEQDFYAGQVKQALDQYQVLEKRFPQVPEIGIRIGMCYRELGESFYSQAEGYFRSYMARRPDDPDGHFEMGVLAYRKRALTEAARYFVQALRLSPRERGNIWLWLAMVLEALEMKEETFYVLEKAEAQPAVENQYRELIQQKISEYEKHHRLFRGSSRDLTFEWIERKLALLDLPSPSFATSSPASMR
jgi:tetratricopeptide (TPR) repeat protein